MATQHGADPGKQLARAEGLGEVVVGAELEAEDAVDLLALGGEHDDRHCQLAADLPCEREPVLAGHAHVEEHQVHAPRSQRLAHVPSVATGHDLELVPDEVVADHLADGGVVVDGKDPLGHREACSGKWLKSLGHFPRRGNEGRIPTR
jgi:hypothetical protein